ncbi:DUF368 domain-containing protein [Ruania halotolerans]|uniref:DUF368 domain-containing protein n=1 Tax=Ruania halotolerans TaxID=2897773 RepID=UPI001E64A9F4|nr:DUF368 domain-containing protein [Ruania halotolerans]UFU05038.1 DUF368 domain-containing protein [Ruania halotolerans]
MTSPTPTAPARRHPWTVLLDFVRGFLIGSAELVPGVSGGTVALVTGAYDRLIDAAAHVLAAARRLVFGPDRRNFTVELRRTDWWLVAPVLIGMATAVLTAAGAMEAFVTSQPEHARGLFFGLVAMSILVPVRMLPPEGVHRLRDVLVVTLAAVVAFVLIGFAGGQTHADPPMILVFFAAAVAICALVIPGVSGAFFLLAIGLYSTTLGALHDRDLGYIAVFAAGAALGLGTFVQILRWLLHSHRRLTLLAMIGLMIGSLRALWPWQAAAGDDSSGAGALLAPQAPLVGPIGLAVLGAAAVGVLIILESRRAVQSGQ